MAQKINKELLALALAFGIITEGMTADNQVQDALDANEGYKLYKVALDAGAVAEAKVVELEGDLSAANAQLADRTAELDTANATIAELREKISVGAEETTPEHPVFTTASGENYAVIQATFRYRGKEYNAADAVENFPDVLETLVEAKSFILKKL